MSFSAFVEWFQQIWPYLYLFVGLPVALWAGGHAILHKKEVRSSIGWVGIIALVPFLGPLFYYLLGINRIQRKASRLLGDRQRMRANVDVEGIDELALEEYLPPGKEHFVQLHRLVERVVKRPLLPGNEMMPLLNGEVAYPAMLKAIEEAETSISFVTYIFDADPVGEEFRLAFKRAKERGVEVRVLIDAVGARYSWPPIDIKMRNDGINAVRFMPTLIPWRATYMNLRNHRKIMVVDGKLGFTGGMNIRVGHDLKRKTDHPVQDMHFKIEGPVVSHLQETFAEDWVFTTGEVLEGELWFPSLEHVGDSYARGIKDGPDEDFEKLRWTILGAIGAAKHSIRIMSPYFLPDVTLASALNLAALRGIEVQIIIPGKNNLMLVDWAMQAHLWSVVSQGCEIFAAPPPFDHTKLMVVDRTWSLIGSTNWDPRSFRLNFEFNVESYDSVFAESLDDFLKRKIKSAKRITVEEIKATPLWRRLRNGTVRLLTPYL